MEKVQKYFIGLCQKDKNLPPLAMQEINVPVLTAPTNTIKIAFQPICANIIENYIENIMCIGMDAGINNPKDQFMLDVWAKLTINYVMVLLERVCRSHTIRLNQLGDLNGNSPDGRILFITALHTAVYKQSFKDRNGLVKLAMHSVRHNATINLTEPDPCSIICHIHREDNEREIAINLFSANDASCASYQVFYTTLATHMNEMICNYIEKIQCQYLMDPYRDLSFSKKFNINLNEIGLLQNQDIIKKVQNVRYNITPMVKKSVVQLLQKWIPHIDQAEHEEIILESCQQLCIALIQDILSKIFGMLCYYNNTHGFNYVQSDLSRTFGVVGFFDVLYKRSKQKPALREGGRLFKELKKTAMILSKEGTKRFEFPIRALIHAQVAEESKNVITIDIYNLRESSPSTNSNFFNFVGTFKEYLIDLINSYFENLNEDCVVFDWEFQISQVVRSS